MCWRALPPKIIADKAKYPFLLPTATVWRKGLENGRHWAQWQDPFPSRAICLRWWPVILTSCAIHSAPALAAKWRWSCVDRGNLDRAPWGDDLAENSDEVG